MSVESHADELPTDGCGKVFGYFDKLHSFYISKRSMCQQEIVIGYHLIINIEYPNNL